jgi:hypothetical protein
MKKELLKKKRFYFRSICILILMSIQISFGISGSGIQAQNANSKQKRITGTVRDNTGEVLPGASIIVKETKDGTTTDMNGSFSLANVLPENTLVVSFVGMTTQEIRVGNQKTINVTLTDGSIGLDEVVAVGYGV